jgi:hypothetical protein
VMSDDTRNESFEALTRLQFLSPDPERTARVRMRCRTRIGQHRKHSARTNVITGFARRVLAPVLVGGFCVLYIAALVSTALRLNGIFH